MKLSYLMKKTRKLTETCCSKVYYVLLGTLLGLFLTTLLNSMEQTTDYIAIEMEDDQAFLRTTIPGLGNNATDDQAQRKALLKKICNKKTPRGMSNVYYYPIIVDDERKVLYCSIPKVASTWIKTVLSYTLGKNDALRLFVHGDYNLPKLGLKRLANYTESEIQYRLEHYYKFLFVRDPYERFLAGYLDKFYRCNDFFAKQYGMKIKQKYRTFNNYSSLGISFTEFMNYIVDSFHEKVPPDAHWATYNGMCSPCNVKYDFIGKLETAQTDFEHLLKDLGKVSGDLSLLTHEYKRTMHTSVFMKSFYQDIKQNIIQEIRKIYHYDFVMFGYDPYKNLLL